MTKSDKDYMDEKFKVLTHDVKELSDVVIPLVTTVAVVKERQKDHPRVNKLYAAIGVCVGLIIALVAVVATLMAITPK